MLSINWTIEWSLKLEIYICNYEVYKKNKRYCFSRSILDTRSNRCFCRHLAGRVLRGLGWVIFQLVRFLASSWWSQQCLLGLSLWQPLQSDFWVQPFLISLIALWPSKIFASHCKLTPQLLGRTILPGFIGYGISSSLLLYAFANFDAGIATVLGSLSPVIILTILWFKEGIKPRLQAVLGAALAVIGTVVIVV